MGMIQANAPIIEAPFYPKIETVFKRDMEGTKLLIPGSFRNPTVEFLKDNKWVFTEKVDGTNVRVDWDGHEVSFCGHTAKSNFPTHLHAKLTEMFCTDEVEELFEQMFGSGHVSIYGEGYGKKIQKAGSLYNHDDCSFIAFDIFCGGLWLERKNVEDICRALNVKVVPIVLTGTIDDAVKYVQSEPKSTLSDKLVMEGVVGRPAVELLDRRGNRMIVKIKVKDHRIPA